MDTLPQTTTAVKLKRMVKSAWETAQTLIIALAVAFFIRYFIAQPFLVSGASMEPDFHNGNFLIVDEITYRFQEPQRGDVIVFHYPGDRSEYFIKRIIGLPGEQLTVAGNTVRITMQNGSSTILAEPYIKEDLRGNQFHKELSLGKDEYFVMGDNRGNSFDSRNWGALGKKDITGIVRLRVFPFNQFGIIKPHLY
jgi:signal peptidase I